jgi:hypothetical protein
MPESGLPIRVYEDHDMWHVDYGEGETEDHTSLEEAEAAADAVAQANSKAEGTAVACSSLPDGSVSLDVVTPRSLLDVRVDLLCLLPMLLGCGLFLTCSVCLLLSCKPGLLRLPATLVRLLAVLASFDTLLVELSRTLAPRDERHGD